MARLIRLPRNPRFEPLPASETAGDFDLFPAAIILWMGSVARVASGAVEGEVFHTEATLALACVVLIPIWMLWVWLRSEHQSENPGRGVDAAPPLHGARVIPLPPRRRNQRTA